MNEWLLLQNEYVIMVGLFLLLVGGAIGLPIPEDIPLILAGVAVHSGSINLTWAFLVCYFGVIAGDLIIFSLGKKLGPAIFQREWFKKRFGERDLKLIRLKLEKRGIWMIFIARHLFYFRTMTFLTCGAVKMSYKRFIVADCIAALISVPIMLWVGYIFSEHALVLAEKAKFWIVLALVIFVALLFGARKLFQSKRKEPDII